MRFDARAAEYSRHARPQAAMVAALVRELPEGRGASALELGAGTGLLTRELVRLGYRVTATDAAPAMVAEGAARVPEAVWETRDAWAPGVACCDFLFSANVLQWAPDASAVMRSHATALRPGGLMRQVIFTEPTLCELRDLAGGFAPLRWRTPADWAAAAADAGLTVRRAETVSLTVAYADARSMLAAIHGTGAVAPQAVFGPGRLRAILREYDRRHPDGAGGVTATWAGVVIEAAQSAA